MTLTKGTLLGPYAIEGLLGAGGMGEVYRARDTRLDRIVAVKVLRPDLTAGNEQRARFEREARAISALSSPHICALYDVGHADDVEYLVMEYLEGETLAARIARGALPLSQLVRYGAEIAEALQHAHRAGITHRDLKPGNVMITAAGVKLLDFGLAKLATQPRIFSADSAPATVVNPITAEGTIVGTVLYMSPEQLEGRAVDHRADIFALGAILYEMATGQRPFGGSSQLSIVAAILSSDPPPPHTLQPACPPALERIILTALEKNPDDRWQTAQDVARQLRWLTDSSSSTTRALPAVRPRSSRLALAVLLAAVLGGLAVWAGLRLLPHEGSIPALRLHLSAPDDVQPLPSPETPNFALSPDGRTLCFVGLRNGVRSLFLRRFDSFDVQKVDGTEGGNSPFWSSDGAWIGFSARGKLWKTKSAGGAVAEPLCDVFGVGAVASWVGDTILFADRAGGRNEIFRLSAHGGAAVKLTTLKADEWRHTWPRLLPDGRHFLYQAAARSLERQLRLASLDAPGSPSVLLRNVSQATFVSEGQLAFVRDSKLLVQRFDAGKGTMLGEPVLVAENVAYFYPSGRAQFDAANGVIVFRTDTSTGRFAQADRHGTMRVIDDHTLLDDLSLSVSQDGQRAAVTVLDRSTGLGDIWLYDLARGVRDRFTNEPGLAITPVWSPDGRTIIYSAAAAGALPHLVRRSLTTSAFDSLVSDGRFQFPGSFSPDGTAVYYTRHDAGAREDVFRLDLRTLHAEPVLTSPFAEEDPNVSPDGKWLAFTSDATGAVEVYLQNLAGTDEPRVRISTNGGTTPRWRRDGGELFYLSAQKGVMSVVPQGSWSHVTPTELFRAPEDTLAMTSMPDGQSFLIVEGSHGAADSLFHVVLGWK